MIKLDERKQKIEEIESREKDQIGVSPFVLDFFNACLKDCIAVEENLKGINLLDNVRLSRYNKTIEKGFYFLSSPYGLDLDISDFSKLKLIFLCVPSCMIFKEAFDPQENKKVPEFYFSKVQNNDHLSKLLRLDNAEFNVAPIYVSRTSNPHPLSLLELLLNFEMQELKRIATRTDLDRELYLQRVQEIRDYLYPPNKPNKRGKRKSNVKSDVATIGKTKAQKVAYGSALSDIKLTPDQYNGQEIKVHEDTHLSMYLCNENIEKRLETVLNSTDALYMESAYAIAFNNPGIRKIYGSDILKHIGKKNPLRKEGMKALEEAFRSLQKQTNTKLTLDKEIEEARKNYVIRDVIERPLIDGDMGFEEYDDGTKDFYIELKYNPDTEPVEQAFPFIQYAMDKKELYKVDNAMFLFTGRNPARIEQVARFIYRETTGTRKNKESMTLEAIINGCDIPPNKNAKTRAKDYVEFVLNDWVKRGYLTSWSWNHKNRRYATGFVVNKYRTKIERIKENCEDW